jgi:uncharacterized membrane protein YesL
VSDEPEPLTTSNFVQVTALQTWSNLPLVVAGGLVFAVAAAPAAVLGFIGFIPLMVVALAILVSPAWASLLDLLTEIAEDRPASLGRMPKAFARLWRRSVRVSLLLVAPIVAGWLILPAFRGERVPAVLWLALAADILALALAWSIGLYAFPMLVTHELPVLDALRNSVILASRHALNTVGMVSMAVLGMIAAGVIGIAVLLFLPALYGMFVVNNFRLVMEAEMDT